MSQGLYHEEFARAGKQAGLQVWRVEKLELVPVPQSAHGDFYVGDAYLVLHTVKAGQGFTYRLHFWLGKEAQAAGPRRAQVGEGRGRRRLRLAGWSAGGVRGDGNRKREGPGDLSRLSCPLRAAVFGKATFPTPESAVANTAANAGRRAVGSSLSPRALTSVRAVSWPRRLVSSASVPCTFQLETPLLPRAAA